MAGVRGRVFILTLAAGLGIGGCRDFHLTTTALDLGPNPAMPGDTVVASFILDLIPSQRHTIRVFIDNTEQLSLPRNGPPPVPVIIEIGDAADLIADHGVGTHLVYIEVTANESGGSTRTRSAVLELQDSSEQED